MIHGSFEYTLNMEDNKAGEKKLPLSGVCTFEVINTKPRGSKAGLDKDGKPVEGAKVWDSVPRMRVWPSQIVQDRVERAYGLGEHEDLEVKHYGIFKEDEPEVTEAVEDVKEQSVEEHKAAKKAAKATVKAAKKAEPVDALDELDEI